MRSTGNLCKTVGNVRCCHRFGNYTDFSELASVQWGHVCKTLSTTCAAVHEPPTTAGITGGTGTVSEAGFRGRLLSWGTYRDKQWIDRHAKTHCHSRLAAALLWKPTHRLQLRSRVWGRFPHSPVQTALTLPCSVVLGTCFPSGSPELCSVTARGGCLQ